MQRRRPSWIATPFLISLLRNSKSNSYMLFVHMYMHACTYFRELARLFKVITWHLQVDASCDWALEPQD